MLLALAAEMRNALKSKRSRATAVVELDWIVRPDTVVRPDVIMICGDPPGKHLDQPPALVAEILSPATRQNGLTYKRELYSSEGVETYLVVDLDSCSIDHYGLVDGEKYELLAPSPAGTIRIHLSGDCEIEIKRADVFG